MFWHAKHSFKILSNRQAFERALSGNTLDRVVGPKEFLPIEFHKVPFLIWVKRFHLRDDFIFDFEMVSSQVP